MQDRDFDVKSLLTPIREVDVLGKNFCVLFHGGQPSIVAIIHTMAAKQGKGYQTLIHELLEKAVSSVT